MSDVVKIQCAPWCEDGDGHPYAAMQRDQNCWGPDRYVGLSLEQVARDSYGEQVSRIGVMAYRGFQNDPHVHLHVDVLDHRLGYIDRTLKVTAAEARALAAALMAVADTIEVA